MKRIEVVCGCILKNQQVYIAKRLGKDAGLWEFPGGKVESDETCQQAIIRELDEELAIKVNVIDKLYTIEDNTKDVPLTVTALCCEIVQGTPTLHVHSEGKWLFPSLIDRSTFHPSDGPIIDALIQFMKDRNL